MKYSIETTENGCIERLEIAGEKLESETVETDFGCQGLGKCFVDQLEEMGFSAEILDKVDDTFGGFITLEFLKLKELLNI